MKKLKIMTVVGTRPEIIRLSQVIKKLESTNAIEHVLVHTGQNYDFELNEVFFQEFGLPSPKHFLDAAKSSPLQTIAACIANIEPILQFEKPDAFLVLGDTNSCLCAIAAKKMKVPIFHMEAGNRCFDQRVPEEINRKIVDHIADFNLTYSDISREYLLREGIPAQNIIKTGSPILEVLNDQMKAIESSNVLSELNLDVNGYFLVSAHREENIEPDDSFDKLVQCLNGLADKYELPVIVSTHPRTRNRIEQKNVEFHPLIRLMKPLGYSSYNKLQINAKAVLSDSGTISEESSLLGLKALNIRDTHERPEAMEEGAAMMVGLNLDRIFQGLTILGESLDDSVIRVADYDIPNVSDKVIKIITSHVDFVNSNNYRK
jgi:UDP-N-acetylglucosamine 2-epimerase (non-hydrolysing)